MARPRTPYRNELKTRVEDEVYAAVRAYQQYFGFSEARAVRDFIAFGAKGLLWNIPLGLIDSSPTAAQVGPKTPA